MSGGYMAVSHLIEIPPPPLLWLAKAAENEATYQRCHKIQLWFDCKSQKAVCGFLP